MGFLSANKIGPLMTDMNVDGKWSLGRGGLRWRRWCRWWLLRKMQGY